MAQLPTRTRFTNLRTLLDKNSGAADAMGRAVSSGIENEGAQIERQLQDTENAFNREVDAARPSALPGDIKTAFADQSAKDAEIARLRPLTEVTYKGPNAISDRDGWTGLQGNVNQTAARNDVADTEFGIQNQARQLFGRPSYTSGMNSLDAGLAGNSAAGQTSIAATKQRFSGLRDALRSTQDRANAKVQGAVDAAKKTREDAAAKIKELEGIKVTPPKVEEYEEPVEPTDPRSWQERVDAGDSPGAIWQDQKDPSRRGRRGRRGGTSDDLP